MKTNWKDAQRVQVDTIEGNMRKGLMLVCFMSGLVPFSFALDPKFFKKVAQWFVYYLKIYEEQFGVIETEAFIPPIRSTLLEDLKDDRQK
jgi:hypothetical protein